MTIADPARFSPWFTLDAEGLAAAPDGPAVVQVKVLGPLLGYPRGQSAMIWYGALGRCAAELPPALAALAAALPTRELRWRLQATPTPRAPLAALLAAFATRFGAVPRFNTPEPHEPTSV